MRRLIAVLVLLGGGWSQLSALGCPMAGPSAHAQSAAGAGAAEIQASHEHHADATGAAHEDPSPDIPHHSDANCQLLVTCAGAVLAGGSPVVVRDLGPATFSDAPGVDLSHTTVFLSHEPPPPRLPV